MNVLLVGHACSPRRGSELAGTWNWAWHLSQRHQVWVITHPQEREAIEGFVREHPNGNLHFVWVTVPAWLDPWRPSDPTSHVGLRHYMLWQRAALRQAVRLDCQIGIDIVHHVSWGTVSEPPLLWRLGIPFVWGPVGGGQTAPSPFRRYFGSAWRAELIRSVRVRLVPYRPTLRNAVRKTALTLATNHETANLLQRAGPCKPRLFLDSGTLREFLSKDPPEKRGRREFVLLWVGRLQPLKGLPLGLEALAQVKQIPFRLLVAGSGPLQQEWESLAGRVGVGDRTTFMGQVPYDQMPALYRSADAFLFTSLRDSFGSQVLEAMAAGLPIVTLNHQGVGAFVPSEAGIKVPVTNPQETVSTLGQAIGVVLSSEELRARMGRAAWEFAATQTWERRAEKMSEWYAEVVRNKERKSNGFDSPPSSSTIS